MILRNYWWLLIWILLGGVILRNAPKRREWIGDWSVKRWDFLPAVLLVLPYILWAGFRPNGFGDTGVYRADFLNAEATLEAAWAILTSEKNSSR